MLRYFDKNKKLIKEMVENNNYVIEPIKHPGRTSNIFIVNYKKKNFILKQSKRKDKFKKELVINYNITKIRNHCPNFLLAYYYNLSDNILLLDKADYILTEYLKNEFVDSKIIKSIIFQVLLAIYILNTRLNIIHEDLNYGNIFIKNTNYEYIQYKINNKFYNVPTYKKLFLLGDFGNSRIKKDNDTNIDNVYKFIDKIFIKFIKRYFRDIIEEKLFIKLFEKLSNTLIKKRIAKYFLNIKETRLSNPTVEDLEESVKDITDKDIANPKVIDIYNEFIKIKTLCKNIITNYKKTQDFDSIIINEEYLIKNIDQNVELFDTDKIEKFTIDIYEEENEKFMSRTKVYAKKNK